MFRDDFGMTRHGLGGLANQHFQTLHLAIDRLHRQYTRERIVAPRHDPLTHEYRQPIRFREQFLSLESNPYTVSKQIDPILECLGDVHMRAITPQERIVPRRCVIVQDDEVANSLGAAVLTGV